MSGCWDGFVDCWDRFGDHLVPSGTFSKSASPNRDLYVARVLVFVFYLALAALFLSQIVALVLSGKVEVAQTGYKVDVLEAPSLAICPFNPNDTIAKPYNSDSVRVVKYTVDGPTERHVSPFDCTFDRDCVCLDLSRHKLRDQNGRAVGVGMGGFRSLVDSGFQERIEVTTVLKDSSADGVLKFGLYDSKDPVPSWVYTKEGSHLMGHLTLQKWTMTDFTLGGILAAIRGNADGFTQQRHIYRYTSEDVGHPGVNDTSLSYEMESFFVPETISSRSAFSIYTLIAFAVLLVMRAAVVKVFIDSSFPKWRDPEAGPEVRDLSWQAEFVANWCFCSCCFCCGGQDDEDKGEPSVRTPLM